MVKVTTTTTQETMTGTTMMIRREVTRNKTEARKSAGEVVLRSATPSKTATVSELEDDHRSC
jgi:hypothetical protein